MKKASLLRILFLDQQKWQMELLLQNLLSIAKILFPTSIGEPAVELLIKIYSITSHYSRERKERYIIFFLSFIFFK